jgi:hypothetical protein
MFKYIRHFFNNVIKLLGYVKKYVHAIQETTPHLKKPMFSIAEIDMHQQVVTIRLRGKGIYLKYPFDETVGDSFILDSLSSEHASILGFSFGRIRQAHLDGKTMKKPLNQVLLSFVKSPEYKYKLCSENLDRTLTYVNNVTKKVFSENPMTIIRNNHVLKHFHPRQACYIGMLAGMNFESGYIKNPGEVTEVVEFLKKKTKLRIV